MTDIIGGDILSQEPIKYDARRIQVLEELEAVRKRPGMYVGSTAERGLRNLVLEATERAANEVLAGRASRVDITHLTFWPDPDIFETTVFSFDELAERFRELALLNRDLEISLTDDRRPFESRSVRFRSPGGARDMVAFLDEREAAPVDPEVIGFEQEDPQMAGTIEVALRWRGSGKERLRSFANSRPTPGGGTHVVGFHDGLAAAINAYARDRHLLAAADLDLATDEIGEGLTAVVSVKLEHPRFEGATHGVLGSAEVRGCVRHAVQEHLTGWLQEHPLEAAVIIDRIIQRVRID